MKGKMMKAERDKKGTMEQKQRGGGEGRRREEEK